LNSGPFFNSLFGCLYDPEEQEQTFEQLAANGGTEPNSRSANILRPARATRKPVAMLRNRCGDCRHLF
jgi:hypothetical protein